MFTGLVQCRGQIASREASSAGQRLTIEALDLPRAVALGDSVCVSGCCLTAAAIDGTRLGFDVVPESLKKTTLGDLGEGDAVNLELAVTPQQPLGGHFMQGHVDGVGEVTAVDQADGQWRVSIRPPATLRGYLIPKGSVAVDGVSLTLAAVSEQSFEVALIPETLSRTTLGEAEPGRRVNLEADILSKTVVYWLERQAASTDDRQKAGGAGVTMDLLRRAGFAG